MSKKSRYRGTDIYPLRRMFFRSVKRARNVIPFSRAAFVNFVAVASKADGLVVNKIPSATRVTMTVF